METRETLLQGISDALTKLRGHNIEVGKRLQQLKKNETPEKFQAVLRDLNLSETYARHAMKLAREAANDQ